MRGSSGAALTQDSAANMITKRDTAVTGRRVRDQGIWLQQLSESRVLPAIFAVHHDRYDMEWLTVPDVPTSWVDTFKMCTDVLEELEKNLWEHEFKTPVPYLVEFDRYDHNAYVLDLLEDVGLRKLYIKKLRQFSQTIDWFGYRTLRVARTHGDCIIDNVAYRFPSPASDPQLVLLDPIPATPPLPDLACVDVGRVIQSVAGYEVTRYFQNTKPLLGIPLDQRVDELLNDWMSETFSLNEARACLHFSIIHMLRGLRTAQRVAPKSCDALEQLVDQLVEVTETWMQ